MYACSNISNSFDETGRRRGFYYYKFGLTPRESKTITVLNSAYLTYILDEMKLRTFTKFKILNKILSASITKNDFSNCSH